MDDLEIDGDMELFFGALESGHHARRWEVLRARNADMDEGYWLGLLSAYRGGIAGCQQGAEPRVPQYDPDEEEDITI